MTKTDIAAALDEQFERAWGMFKAAVERLDDQAWLDSDGRRLAPARHAYHVVETADFYTGTAGPKDFPWGRRFGGLWDTVRTDKLPARQQVLAYLDEVRQKVRAWLSGLDDAALLSADERFGWTGGTLLGRAVYLLRHIQHHTAEINADLRRRGLPVVDWR